MSRWIKRRLSKEFDDFKLGFKPREYDIFLSKYIGCFLKRGKYSIALNKYIEVLYYLKQFCLLDPLYVLNIALNNLMPVLTTKMVKIGRNVFSVPAMLKKKGRKYNLMFKWLLRAHKNKSNIRGVKVRELAKYIFDAARFTGILMRLKKKHLADALVNTHMLYKKLRRRINTKAFGKKLLKQAEKEEKEKIYKFYRKEEVITARHWTKLPYNNAYLQWKKNL